MQDTLSLSGAARPEPAPAPSSPVSPHAAYPAIDRGPVLIALFAICAVSVVIGLAVDVRQAALFLIGSLFGITLFHASFGFAGGWRRMVVEKRGRGIRVQMLMIGVAAIAFIPLLAFGHPLNGARLVGAFAPVGVSVLVGALLFGLGMQLAGGCGSGTLFTVGGGSARMLLTLLFFIFGALMGTAHMPWWLQQATLPAVDLGAMFGLWQAVALTLVGLGLVALASAVIERRAHGGLEAAPVSHVTGWRRMLHGPWPLVAAGLALAGLNIATLLVAGHPWSITYAFGLWGAKVAHAVGVPVAEWTFWSWPVQAQALNSSVLYDSSSVMDFGTMLGAALAAGLGGRFAVKAKLPAASLVAAGIGGILMGYGARLAFGCNIGALFGGIASGSLHGWLWLVAAFIGSLLGIWLRPMFGLEGFRKK